jgi:hypothetical protein
MNGRFQIIRMDFTHHLDGEIFDKLVGGFNPSEKY